MGRAGGTPTRKEPQAKPGDYKKYVVHHPDLPFVELVPGSNSKLVAGKNAMLSFLTMEPHSYYPPHKHEAEQLMIVLDGYIDEIIDGKLYRLKKGDVCILPSNVEHGGYLGDVPCVVIDVFAPPRKDFLEKIKKLKG